MRETLLSFLDDSLARGGETAALNWRGLRLSPWSYAELAAGAFRFARELEARRIGHGDRVLFWGENSPEWIAAFFGCLLRGAVVVPLDRHSTPDFAARVQQQVSAKLLVTDESAHTLNLPQISLSDLVEAIARHSDKPYVASNIRPDDLIEIIFTSGTTGEPKGVCLTHRNFLANLAPLESEFKKYSFWLRLIHPVRLLCLLPLSHVFGQFVGIFVAQILGAEVYFRDSFNPSEIVELIRKQRIRMIATVPRVLETLRDKIERDATAGGQRDTFAVQLQKAQKRNFLHNWWSFRRIHKRFGMQFLAFVTGGATLEPDTEGFWRKLGFAVIQGYGMTETASLTSYSHPFRMVPHSIGQKVANQELKLDEGGEILVRGANVSPGYWREGTMRPMTDEQGWLRTGDLGDLDATGNIYFRGRGKETIVTAAGLKIYPADLETALDRQPEIKVSVVLPMFGPAGPEPLAVLIPRNGDSDLASAVKRACGALAQFQQIRHWVIWPESDFPRTPATGKIIKGRVADAVKKMKSEVDGRKALPAARQPSTTSTIAPLVSRIAGVPAGELNSTAKLSEDLKLDSLGRVELLSALEDLYQIELDEAAFTTATTIGDIDRMVREGKAEMIPYPYPEWAMRFPAPWLREAFYYLVLLPLSMLLCRARVRGLEHLHRVQGPVLFISNHITAIDPAIIMAALPRRWHKSLAIAMIGEYLRDWLHPPAGTAWLTRLKLKLQYGLVAAFFNVFSLPQGSGFRRSFSYAGAAMDRGWNILLFPEGQRTKDGRLNPFMAGTGLLVADLNAPVIPIRIDGLFELKRQHKHIAKPGAVTITFGAPVTFKFKEQPTQITRELQSRLAAL